MVSIAVIGAGAGGLAACRSFVKRGLAVSVFESSAHVGGVWRYSDDPTRPMYKNLRTNLPKEVMGFKEYPFSNDIPESYLTHEQVQHYLEDYTNHFDLKKHILFNSPVLNVAYEDGEVEQKKFRVTYGDKESSVFDAVVVCNGHYSIPNSPKLPNLTLYKGRVLHSVSYNAPEDFADEAGNVLCVGGNASGGDIAKEISTIVNKEVYVCKSGGNVKSKTGRDNIFTVPKLTGVSDDGEMLTFEDSSTLKCR